MPIVQPKKDKKPKKAKFLIDPKLADEIDAYCDWAKADHEAFFTQAAELVLKKDKDWKQYKKGKKGKRTG